MYLKINYFCERISCFFIGLFNFLIIFSQVARRLSHNVKKCFQIQNRTGKRHNKTRTRLFTLSK